MQFSHTNLTVKLPPPFPPIVHFSLISIASLLITHCIVFSSVALCLPWQSQLHLCCSSWLLQSMIGLNLALFLFEILGFCVKLWVYIFLILNLCLWCYRGRLISHYYQSKQRRKHWCGKIQHQLLIQNWIHLYLMVSTLTNFYMPTPFVPLQMTMFRLILVSYMKSQNYRKTMRFLFP